MCVCVCAFQRICQSVSDDQPLCRELQVWFGLGGLSPQSGASSHSHSMIFLRGILARERQRDEGMDG